MDGYGHMHMGAIERELCYAYAWYAWYWLGWGKWIPTDVRRYIPLDFSPLPSPSLLSLPSSLSLPLFLSLSRVSFAQLVEVVVRI